jgi:peptidyl-prolyl cis-trans isomerase C
MIAWASVLGLIVCLGACPRGPERRGEAARGEPVVGGFAGGAITQGELAREAERLPPELRERFASDVGKRELVRSMIDKRLLAQEARRRGIVEDPQILRQVVELEERLVIQALLAGEERAAGAVGEAELRAYFEAHKEELAQPERVRVALVASAASDAAAKRALARAQGFAVRLRKGEPIAKVAAEGDGPERTRGGDLGLLERSQLKDPAVAAAFASTDSVSVEEEGSDVNPSEWTSFRTMWVAAGGGTTRLEGVPNERCEEVRSRDSCVRNAYRRSLWLPR